MELQNFATLNQDHGSESVSGKYGFIPTMRVVNTLKNMGWLPVKVQENRVVKADGRGFQKHLVRFRQEGASSLMVKDQVFPEIVVTNSHDGLASFQIMAGLFRLVCLNGMVICNEQFGGIHRVKHIGYTDEKVREAVSFMGQTVPLIADSVKAFNEIELTPDEQGIYAMASIQMKYGETDRAFNVEALLKPRRTEDRPPTLWNTYNVIQEKLIKGNRFEVNKGKGIYEGQIFGTKKARGVTAITEDIRINRALWMLTERMADIKRSGASGCNFA